MADPLHLAYRNMLLELSSLIDDGDLDRIKFRCDNIIKKAESQKIKDPIQLFTALEQREHLGPRNVEFLKELLMTCCRGKMDGVRQLEHYERNWFQPGMAQPPIANRVPGSTNGVADNHPQVVYVIQGNQTQNLPPGVLRDSNRQRYHGPDLNPEIGFLCTKLGRDWRFFIRSLGVSEDEIETIAQDYSSVKEKIRQCLLLWQMQEQQCASKQKLIDALRLKTVERNDLAMNLEDGTYF